MIIGGIEAGGTKCVGLVGAGPTDVRAYIHVPTTSPDETLGALVTFFQDQARIHSPIAAIGIASFGPLELEPTSPRYGHITTTPKPGWAWTDLVGPFRDAFAVPVAIDTDVNAAAIGEWRYGAAQGVESVVYLTVGTGIGGGVIVNGRPLHGLVHPEMGHLRIPHDRVADPFDGVCPFHSDCLEGLASGTAIAARWRQPAETLPPDHPAWALEARYLALGLHNIVCTLSPKRLVLGGGVMVAPGLLARVRVELGALLNAYVQSPALANGLAEYVVAPALAPRSGAVGALALASDLVSPSGRDAYGS